MKINGGILPFFGKRVYLYSKEDALKFADYLLEHHPSRAAGLAEEIVEAMEVCDLFSMSSWNLEWLDRVFFQLISRDRMYYKFKDS